MPEAFAKDSKPRDWQVRYGPNIEPLVRLIEETPEEKCLEAVVREMKSGLSYREFMVALFLAGLRNRGDFGYCHCIYMIHSANQLALDSPAGDHLVSMFATLEVFKYWQQARWEGTEHFGWRKRPKNLPTADRHWQSFMTRWRKKIRMPPNGR